MKRKSGFLLKHCARRGELGIILRKKETEGKAPYDITEPSVEKSNTICENRKMESETERKFPGVEHAGHLPVF